MTACFTGTAEDIRAHHKLVADAKAQGAAEERARVVRFIRAQGWALHFTSAEVARLCEHIERGEHVR